MLLKKLITGNNSLQSKVYKFVVCGSLIKGGGILGCLDIYQVGVLQVPGDKTVTKL